MKTTLKIEGLSCGHCVNAVNNILNEIEGVTASKVSLPDTAEIDFDQNIVGIEEIKQEINNSEIYKVL